VPPTDSFPFGVKMTYRKYTQNEVILIEQSDNANTYGFRVRNAVVTIQPEEIPPLVPEGMYLLKSLPPADLELTPDAFIQGSRLELEKVVSAIAKTFLRHLPATVDEWINFRDTIAPQDDSAERYMAEKGMKIPFKDQLFNGSAFASRESPPMELQNLPERETVRFTGSVQWSGRGHGRNNIEDAPYVCVGMNDAAFAAPVACSDRQRNCRKKFNSISEEGKDSSSDDEPRYDYIPLQSSCGPESDYFKYVGRKFSDSADGGTFEVTGICDMRKEGARRSTNIVYAFQYVNIDGDREDFLYTPVREMLNSYWCRWLAVESRSSRLREKTATQPSASSKRPRR
jgi:hypothetical protein